MVTITSIYQNKLNSKCSQERIAESQILYNYNKQTNISSPCVCVCVQYTENNKTQKGTSTARGKTAFHPVQYERAPRQVRSAMPR